MKLCIGEKIIEKLGEYGGKTLGKLLGEELLEKVAPEENISVVELNRRLAQAAEPLGFEEISFGIENGRGRLRVICENSCTSLLFLIRGIAENLLSSLFNLSPDGERVVNEEVVFFFGHEGGLSEATRRKLEFLKKLWHVAQRRQGESRDFPGEHLLNPTFSPQSSLAEYKKFLGI